MHHHTMESLCVRYYGVQFQGKVGVLTINDEKVLFRPKVEASQGGEKPPTRSWRWAAVERIEVLDPPRSNAGGAVRGLKLKSKNGGGKGVTLKVPQESLEEVLMDMNSRLGEDALGIEGAVLKSTPLVHKAVPPLSQRRSSMPAATTLNVSAKDSLKTSSLHSPKKRTSQTLKTHKKLSGSRRASMPTLSTSKPETIPEQAEVKSPEASPTQERFLDKVGNKFKLTNTRPMEKDNANKTEEESLRPLLVSTSMRSSGDASTGSKESVSRRARKFLDFVRPPPPRRNVTAEIEETERKMKEQLARTKAIHKKNKDRRRSLQDAKIKQESARELHSPSSHSVASQQQRRRRHSLHTTTPPPQSTPTQQPKPKVQMTTRKPRKEEPVKKINRDAVFNDIIKEEEKDNTSVTEAASFTENSPEPAPAVLWNPDSPENKFKMMILSHAASCREKKGSCPYDPVCSEHQNLLEHIEKCTEDADCTYPRCVPTRNFLVTMRLMEKGGANDASTKDFLVGMGAIAPVPVIDISALSECCKPVSGDWDAFSAVSNTSWWEHAGH